MNNLIVNRFQFIFLFFLLESLILYWFAPNEYKFGFNLYCMIHFILSSVLYIVLKRKDNYFDFDCIFLISIYFTLFFFPVFIYNTIFEKFLFAYDYYYNENLISKATALALLGAHSYMFGGSLVKKENKAKFNNNNVISNQILILLSLLCFILFLFSAGSNMFTHTYDGSIGGEEASGTVTYILVLLSAIMTTAFVVEFNNWSLDKQYKKNLILFIILFTFVGVFLKIGSRTYPLQYILLVIGLYSIKIRKINFKELIILIILGFSLLGIIGLSRINNDSVANDLQDNMGALVFIQDLLLNNRNTFVAMDIVDKYGYDYGSGMLTPILGIFPFANTTILNLTPLTELDMSSGLRITAYSLGKTSDFEVGFGTNIIADLYMSFGSPGVIILMAILGYYINLSLEKVKEGGSIYYLLIYAVMISYSVFIVRAEYFIFLRLLIWSLAIINITKLHPYKFTFKIKR